MNNNRLLLEISNAIRELNCEIINPEIPELTLAGIKPVMAMVARSRAAYLKELFDITGIVGEGHPTHDQISRLKDLRQTYQELVEASQALEGAIERGYLDIQQ